MSVMKMVFQFRTGFFVILLATVTGLRGQGADQPFTLVPTTLPAVQDGAATWGDYDNDGDLDLALTGRLSNGNRHADIYRNDGAGGFVALNVGIPGIHSSAVDWGDYDNDGDLDLAINGTALNIGPFTRVYRNNGNGTFQDINAGLPGAFRAFIAWVDYNNDGLLDLTYRGYAPGGDSGIYRNAGGGTFVRAPISLPAMSDGSGGWADVDNDGDHDLLLTSVDSLGSLTRLLLNREGSFTEFDSLLPAVGNAEITHESASRNAGHAWGDFDQDGVVDVLIWGYQLNARYTYVYRGRGNGRFTAVSGLNLPPIFGSGAWGDYDANGHLDFALTGQTQSGGLYLGQGNGSFSEDSFALTPAGSSAAAWGDYDADGDLDLLVAGFGSQAFLYQNNRATPNTPPTTPANPTTTLLPDNYVALTWDPPSDAETTNRYGFSYNIRVGTSSGAIDVASPHSDLNTGRRRVARLGNAGHTNRWLLINLAPGTYYWSVQAIDPGLAGSPFSAEASFTVTNTRPTISQISKHETYPSRATAPIPFTIGDLETLPEDLVLSASSSIPSIVPNENITFGGSGSARAITITPLPNKRGTVEITVVVTDGGTGTARTTFALEIAEFTWLPILMPPFNGANASWGDYDRDGDFDLFLNGSNARLLRNDGGNSFTSVGTGTPFERLGYGASAWGDYDNDGDIDLAMMGTVGGGISFLQSELYQNLGNGLFTNRVRIPQVGYGSMQWGDYDADGDLDLLQVGQFQSYAGLPTSFLSRNDGGSGFTVFSNYFGRVAYGVALWGDLDNDSFLDVFVAGSSNAVGIQLPGAGGTRLYRNNRNGSFTEMSVNLPQLSHGVAAAFGDYDNDGDLDIALSGIDNTTLRRITHIYRNDILTSPPGQWRFGLAATNFIGVTSGSLAWGDYDNDNDLDLLVCGSITGDASSPTTHLYRNDGAGVFVDLGLILLPPIQSGGVAFGDYDNDGDLDLVLHGQSLFLPLPGIYENHLDPWFEPVPAPANLRTEVLADGSASLFWSAQRSAHDTYNVAVWRDDGTLVVSPQADMSTGRRYIPEDGNAGRFGHKRLRRLPRGTYHWAVQAIDMRYHGSPFSTNRTFVIDTPLLPSMDPPPPASFNEDAPMQSRPLTGISPGDGDPQSVTMSMSFTNVDLFRSVGWIQPGARSTGQVNILTWPNAYGRGYIFMTVRSIFESQMLVSASYTMVVDVLPVNDAPVARFQLLTNELEDTVVPIVLEGLDAEGDPLTYSIFIPPQFGFLTGSGAARDYHPLTNYFGWDQFWFRVNDGKTNSEPAQVQILLNPVPDIPEVLTGIQRLPNGQLQFNIRGEPYEEYSLETSQNLKDWSQVRNLVASPTGQVSIEFGTGDPYRFYRVRSVH
jgi:VCBS repeat protein/Big-like domain-containing protein